MSNQDDPWASRVAAIFGEEVSQPEERAPKPDIATGLAGMLRNMDNGVYNSPVVSRYQQIVGRERGRLKGIERPLFIESSYVSDPAYGSLPYQTAELVTKEGGLPREVKYNGRLYVKADASLVLSEKEWSVLSTQPRLNIDDQRDDNYRPIVGNWPSQISIASETYVLYREGQYDIVGINVRIDNSTLDNRDLISFASMCSLCEEIVFMLFRIDEVKLMEASSIELIKEYLFQVKDTTCPNCKNEGKVP